MPGSPARTEPGDAATAGFDGAAGSVETARPVAEGGAGQPVTPPPLAGDPPSRQAGHTVGSGQPPGRRGSPWWSRVVEHPDSLPLLVGLLLGLAVCWPLLGGRPLFLLDWVSGPRPPLPSTTMLGLDGGLTAGVVGGVVMTVLVKTVGEASTWLVLFAFFPLAAVGVARLAGGWRWARLAAVALFCVNPFVFNRIFAGQLSLLVGYALLPYAVISALGATRWFTRPSARPSETSSSSSSSAWASSRARATARGIRWRWPAGIGCLSPVLWWAVLTAISPHYVWIYGLVLLAVVVVSRPFTWKLVAWLAGSSVTMGVLSLYILLPHSATELPTTVGTTSLDLYKTAADPHLGLLPNVAALYGFWRLGPGPQLPKDVVTGWPLLMLAMLVVIVAGYLTVLHRRQSASGTRHSGVPDSRRRLAWVLVVVGVAGYFLALGSQGPTGALFRWAYDNVPFFAIMREPQKFLMLTALAYAVGLAWGVERLAGSHSTRLATTGTPSTPSPNRNRNVLAAAAIGLVLPLGYTPTMFDGLAGQIAPSTIPASYRQADNRMGDGPGRILYLPWHLYEALPFTDGRVVATLGPTVFRRTVIAGDNVQAGGVQTQSTSLRSAYLQRLFDTGNTLAHFGADIAPLGIEYVVLAKAVNWRSYGWLDHQSDLRLVLDSRSLVVWRNLDYFGPGRRPGADRPVRQESLVAYQIPPGPPGTVEIDAAYQPGWKFDGHDGRPSAQGTVVFTAGAAGGVAQFRPWGLVKLGDALSGGGFVLLAGVVWWDRRRGRGRDRPGRNRRDRPAQDHRDRHPPEPGELPPPPQPAERTAGT